MSGPLVSIVVPVYNVESYIEECLQSVCSQGSSSKALSNFAPRELLSITQAKFLCKRLFRVLLKSFLKLMKT